MRKKKKTSTSKQQARKVAKNQARKKKIAKRKAGEKKSTILPAQTQPQPQRNKEPSAIDVQVESRSNTNEAAADRVSEARKLINKISAQFDGDSYIFRGESKKYEKISSGLYRHYCMPKQDNAKQDNSKEEDRQADGSQKNVSLIDPEYFSTLEMTGILIDRAKQYFVNKESDIEILTELQHQGGKTALIDFTSCVYISLYFACSADAGEHGRLLILDKSKLKEFDKRIIDWKPGNTVPNQTGTYFVNPEGSSERAAFQKSVFVFPVRGFLEKDEIFHEFEIKEELKGDILDYLFKKYGIEEKTIYDDLQGFIRRELSDPYIDFYQGLSLYKQGEYAQAIEKYKEVLKINPRHAQTYINRGIAKADLGKREKSQGYYEDAINDYDQGLKINPKYAEAYLNRGTSKTALGRHKEAIEDYDKALEINPKYAEAYGNRGVSKIALGRYAEAIEDCNQVLKINPEDAGAYVNRGIAKANLSKYKYEEVIEDFDKALTINPEHAGAYLNRGIAKANFGKDEEAIKDYDKALEINPNFAEAYVNRGNAKAALGSHKEAIKDYDKALEINSQYADAYYFRGFAKAALKQYEEKEVVFDFQKALALHQKQGNNDRVKEIEEILSNIKKILLELREKK